MCNLTFFSFHRPLFNNIGSLLTYHIEGTSGGNYVVTTSGSCRSGSTTPCQFVTTLAPDQGANYSPAYLANNGVSVTTGTYQP